MLHYNNSTPISGSYLPLSSMWIALLSFTLSYPVTVFFKPSKILMEAGRISDYVKVVSLCLCHGHVH